MKKFLIIFSLLCLITPVYATEFYDVSEEEAYFKKLKDAYNEKCSKNLPCGNYDTDVLVPYYSWLIDRQREGKSLQGVNPQMIKGIKPPKGYKPTKNEIRVIGEEYFEKYCK